MRSRFHFAVGVATVLAGTCAFADVSHAESRSTEWTCSRYICVPLRTAALLYLVGLLRMRQRGTRLGPRSILCFFTGWFSLLIVLDSPVHEISEQLFWVHMTQHEILMLISAPLLILSQPTAPFLFALPELWRSRVANTAKTRVVERVSMQRCEASGCTPRNTSVFWELRCSSGGHCFTSMLAASAMVEQFCTFSPPRSTPVCWGHC